MHWACMDGLSVTGMGWCRDLEDADAEARAKKEALGDAQPSVEDHQQTLQAVTRELRHDRQ